MEPPASATTPRLAWKWILEKLLDLPDFGVAFVNEVITSHVKDIEEPHSRPLLERVALRNLEEMVATNQIDSGAIPLLKAVTKQDDVAPGTTTGASINKQRSNETLMLRVQTEAVLSVLRKCVDEGEKNWAFFESELERVFGEAGEDNRLLERKRELSALLKSKNQMKATVAACLEKYSLNKLRNDLFSFVDQRRESFKTKFLDQLSRDFLDANGRPFSEKATKVEANGKQDHVCTVNAESSHEFEDLGDRNCQQSVGQTPKVNGTQGASGKKRQRRKLLPTQDGVGDGGSEEAEEGSAGTKKKSRKVSTTSIVNPLKISLRAPVKQEVGLCQLLSLLNGGKEEPLSGPRDLGLEVMRTCSPAAHERGIISMEGAKIPPREPSRTNKYVSVSDVESDADTQVVKRLSTDSLVEKGDGDNKHNKRGAPSLSENGSKWRHPQNIVETEAVRKETSIEQSEKKLLVYNRRKEASAGAPEVKVSQQEDNENFVTKNGFIPLDNSQDIHEVDFLEVGSDGHEEVCHVCGKHGELRGCDGCPISIDFNCIKLLGLRLPKSEENWYCPVCLSLKAEKAAVAAKEKLKAFHMESKKRRSYPEEDALHHRNQRQEKAAKHIRVRFSSLQSRENERVLKPKQQSDEEPKLRYTEGQQQDSEEMVPGFALQHRNRQEKAAKQSRLRISSLQSGETEKALMKPKKQQSDEEPKLRLQSGENERALKLEKQQSDVEQTKLTSTKGQQQDPDPSKVSLVSTVLKKALRQLNQLGDRDFDQSLLEDASPEVARRDPFAASTSGQVKPGSGAGGRRDIEGDEGDEDLDEDRGEKPEDRKQGASLSGRRKLPGVRRKPLPWTREEEHALKEGVKRFSHNGSWGFQWRKILEFGRGSFDPSRTDVDLKDKWRNLVKGVL